MKKVTNKELEQERINIEKEAKVLYSGMPTIQFEAYLKKIREEKRLNTAENQDLNEQIASLINKKPADKPETAANTVLPCIGTAIAGSIVASWLLANGMLPNVSANDINDSIGVGFAGFAAGGMAGLVNAFGYCTRPITKAIINRQIAKRQRKIAENQRRNTAINYLEECLWNEEQRSLNDEEDPTTVLRNPNADTEDENQINIDDYMSGRI